MDENKTDAVVEKTPEQLEEEMVVAEVNATLAKYNYGLRPFLVYHENGLFPGVKPVKLGDAQSVGQTSAPEGDGNLDAKIV